MATVNSSVTYILENSFSFEKNSFSFVCAQQKNEAQTDLEQHEGE